MSDVLPSSCGLKGCLKKIKTKMFINTFNRKRITFFQKSRLLGVIQSWEKFLEICFPNMFLNVLI